MGKMALPQLIDARTGEQWDLKASRRRPRFPLRFIGSSYMILFAEGIRRIKVQELNRVEGKVWAICLETLDFKHWTTLSARSFAANIDENPTLVTKALRKLSSNYIDKNTGEVIIRQLLERRPSPVGGKMFDYRIDSDIGWYGNGEDWREWQLANGKLKEPPVQTELRFAK